MESVWGKTSRGFQRTVLPVLLDMRCSDGEPVCVLMIQGMGGCKYTIPRTVGTVFGGVTLVIENTLSLGKNIDLLFQKISK